MSSIPCLTMNEINGNKEAAKIPYCRFRINLRVSYVSSGSQYHLTSAVPENLRRFLQEME